MRRLINEIYIRAEDAGIPKKLRRQLYSLMDRAEYQKEKKRYFVKLADEEDAKEYVSLLLWFKNFPFASLHQNGSGAVKIKLGLDLGESLPIATFDPAALEEDGRSEREERSAIAKKNAETAEQTRVRGRLFCKIFVQEFRKAEDGQEIKLDSDDRGRLRESALRKLDKHFRGRSKPKLWRQAFKFVLREWKKSEVRRIAPHTLIGFCCGKPMEWFCRRERFGYGDRVIQSQPQTDPRFKITGHHDDWSDFRRRSGMT